MKEKKRTPKRDMAKGGRRGDEIYRENLGEIDKKAKNRQLWHQLVEALCADRYEEYK